jgi:hypothetical protein
MPAKVVFTSKLSRMENGTVAGLDRIQIAWDYLERTGEIEDAAVASRFLYDTIGLMIRRGERRLALSNRAITAYKRFKQQRTQLGQAFA